MCLVPTWSGTDAHWPCSTLNVSGHDGTQTLSFPRGLWAVWCFQPRPCHANCSPAVPFCLVLDGSSLWPVPSFGHGPFGVTTSLLFLYPACSKGTLSLASTIASPCCPIRLFQSPHHQPRVTLTLSLILSNQFFLK